MNKSMCYLSDDYSKRKHYFSNRVIICPESTLNGLQIQQWVKDLKDNPKEFFTCSLYLIRELYLQKVDVVWVNLGIDSHRNDNQDYIGDSCDEIGNIEILDRDLEQSDRYINFENKVSN